MQIPLDPEFRKYQGDLLGLLDKYVNSPTYRGGFYSFVQINQLIDILQTHGDLISGRKIIDFGCGATRPVAASILLYLLGGRSALALDLEMPFDLAGIAVAEYANLLCIISGRSQLNHEKVGQNLADLRRRSLTFDLSALLSGDLDGGLGDHVKHKISRYQDLDAGEKEFDLMISNSVFEHVADIKDCMVEFRENISPNGFIYSSIDFRDHRFYSQGKSPWEYLTDDGDHTPGYINKIRFTEMMQIATEAGFEIVSIEQKRETPPDFIISNLNQKYKALTPVDIETTEAQVLWKPSR